MFWNICLTQDAHIKTCVTVQIEHFNIQLMYNIVTMKIQLSMVMYGTHMKLN